MSRRFFAAFDLSPDQFELSGPEAHHLLRVLRMKTGEQVWLFDGQGHEVLAEILGTEEHGLSAQFKILERRTADNDSAVSLTIATGVPKGDRFSWLVEKLVELGVQRLIPLISKHSIVDPGAGKLDKLRRTIIEASKQCGRTRLMELAEPQSWSACVAQEFPNHSVYIAHPGGESFEWSTLGRENSQPGVRPPLFLVGPEGGFTETEIAQAVHFGARLVRLGTHILRIETAAVAIAALVGLQVKDQ
ncbi:MAG: Ribosomal small subunit methyltransferase [Planctomycetaceae bacterium]|nr:Ribosomal small subunit methyltransferase [Planctomycetaceae bacterium]